MQLDGRHPMAAFEQLFVSAGVDEDRHPKPGMIVPLFGSNVVRLTGGKGRRIEAPPTLAIKELSFNDVGLASLIFNPGGALKASAVSDSRYFQISSKVLISPDNPATVKAVGQYGSADLNVAVVKQRKVKLSIRPVQVLGPQGGLVFHSQKPFDTKAMVATMNGIWTPQANVSFELVSETPAPITKEEDISKIWPRSDSRRDIVNMTLARDVLNRNKDPNADFTMFLVQFCGWMDGNNFSSAEGVGDDDFPVALISDGRVNVPEMPAHEAGHFIGTKDGKRFPHTSGRFDLMKVGGNVVAKIPFDHVTRFNPP
jgi:hypothetical protein